MEKSPQGFCQTAPKRVFLLLPIKRGLSDTYPALISTMFEITDGTRCTGAYTRKNFSNFYVGVLQAPKNCPGSGTLGGVLVTSVQLKWHNLGR